MAMFPHEIPAPMFGPDSSDYMVLWNWTGHQCRDLNITCFGGPNFGHQPAELSKLQLSFYPEPTVRILKPSSSLTHHHAGALQR